MKMLPMTKQEWSEMKLTTKDFNKAKRALEAASVPRNDFIIMDDLVPSNPDPKLQERCQYWYNYLQDQSGAAKTKGNNPMAYNNSPTTANVSMTVAATAPKSDTQTQREYLLSRLDGLKSRYDSVPPKLCVTLRELFNLDAPGFPRKPQDLIDAITKGKFTLDQKRIDKINARQEEYDEDESGYDAWDDEFVLGFFKFTDLPKADRKGFDAAIASWESAAQATRDTIMTGDAAAGLAALQALEAWTPTGKPN